MNALHRFLRFNLVGAGGAMVQLGAVATLHSLAPAHYLFASACAVELAVLHNFLWHRRYTWRDRADVSATQQLLRFHLANGAVSLLGNVALVGVMHDRVRLPLFVLNAIAIAVCSVVNFACSGL